MAREPAVKKRRLSPPGDGGDNATPGFTKWNLEQDYENRPRKGKKDEKHKKLPIKHQSGIIEEAPVDPEPAAAEDGVDGEDNDSFLDSGDEKDSGVADVQQEVKEEKPKLSPKEEIRQAKEELARIAGLISEGPEEHIGLLGGLAEMAASKNATVKKLALGTQLSVYKDIIPGYRIRPLSKDDMTAKLSKDVRKLRNFEQSLLGGFKDYVQDLRKTANKSGSEQAASLATVATACACNLLTSVPHFNCRNDLISLMVGKLGARHLGANAQKCIETLEQLFREDEDGHSSLEAVSQITKMMKTKNYHVHENVLNTFLHLRLLSEFAHKASTNRIDKPDDEAPADKKVSKKQREFRTKRERKVMRERKAVEKEMQAADATVSYEERDKNQADTLKLVFVAYFRILKARVPNLMGAVLEGLARYSHLINQDFFGDILEALKDLINDAETHIHDPETSNTTAFDDPVPSDDEEETDPTLSTETKRNATRETLLCITTAFALLQGQETLVTKSAPALGLDLHFFTTHLYRLLLPLSLDPDIELSSKKTSHLRDPNDLPTPTTQNPASATVVNVATTSVLLLRSLHAVLLPAKNTRSVPPSRIAAFTKQLLTCSLHLPPKTSTAVMALLQQVSKVHGSKISYLWNSEERKGDGVWDPLAPGVEAGNVGAASLWEGELVRAHWSEGVREGYAGVLRGVRESGK
ncbi:hypothetical protein MBLNU230_g4843t1 [Neophaeotheca triangularis]